MTNDGIVDVEMRRPSTRYERTDVPGGWILCAINERGTFWVREYRWPFWVDLVQWDGTPLDAMTTGEVIRISIPRYWIVWWRVWWRRRHPSVPKAIARSRQ